MKPIIILGKTSSQSTDGFTNISGPVEYTGKPTLAPGIPPGMHMTSIRIGRTIIAIGPGGYMDPGQ